MNHKRKRPKNRRAGCLMCKANKMNGWSDVKFFHHGWRKIKKLILSKIDETDSRKD